MKQLLIVLGFVLIGQQLVKAQFITAQQFRCMFPHVPQQRVNTWIPILNQG
jgi:hypothetical protein